VPDSSYQRPEDATPFLVIGYGNTLRGDDGVGPRLIAELEKRNLPGVTPIARALLTPELADPVSCASKVIFADAAVDAPRETQLRRLEPAKSSQIMAHAASPDQILALARDLYGRAPQAWWLTIPAEDLSFGEEFSAITQRGLEQALQMVLELTANGGQQATRTGFA